MLLAQVVVALEVLVVLHGDLVRYDDRHVLTDQLLACPTELVHCRVAARLDDAFDVDDKNRDNGQLRDGVVRGVGLEHAELLGDVAREPNEDALLAELDLLHRDLNGELLQRLFHSRDAAGRVNDRFDAGLEVLAHDGVVVLRDDFGHQHLDVVPNNFVSTVPELLAGGFAERQHSAVSGHHNNRDGRKVCNCARNAGLKIQLERLCHVLDVADEGHGFVPLRDLLHKEADGQCGVGAVVLATLRLELAHGVDHLLPAGALVRLKVQVVLHRNIVGHDGLDVLVHHIVNGEAKRLRRGGVPVEDNALDVDDDERRRGGLGDGVVHHRCELEVVLSGLVLDVANVDAVLLELPDAHNGMEQLAVATTTCLDLAALVDDVLDARAQVVTEVTIVLFSRGSGHQYLDIVANDLLGLAKERLLRGTVEPQNEAFRVDADDGDRRRLGHSVAQKVRALKVNVNGYVADTANERRVLAEFELADAQLNREERAVFALRPGLACFADDALDTAAAVVCKVAVVLPRDGFRHEHFDVPANHFAAFVPKCFFGRFAEGQNRAAEVDADRRHRTQLRNGVVDDLYFLVLRDDTRLQVLCDRRDCLSHFQRNHSQHELRALFLIQKHLQHRPEDKYLLVDKYDQRDGDDHDIDDEAVGDLVLLLVLERNSGVTQSIQQRR
eukprot:PhM_4_TR16058/c0_g1_i1/m.98469